MNLVNRENKCHTIWAFGITSIMEPPDTIDLTPVRDMFPHIEDNVFTTLKKAQIDLLIGLDYYSLHPDGGQGRNVVGNFRALHSQFSTGWVFGGSHPSLKLSATQFSGSAQLFFRCARVDVKPVFNSIKAVSLNFMEQENLGVLPARRCNGCLSCKDCKDSTLVFSRKEQDELQMLETNVEIIDNKVHVSYPFIRSPNCLLDNRERAIQMATKMAARLEKKGQLDKYSAELQKYIDRGVIVKISQDEKDSWKGPLNYIIHHGVEKDSATTPLRIVTNSSLKNGKYSLNDCLPKGPNSLNSMYDIMMRFRCYQTGLVYDLSKAYNTMQTGLVEKHLRRLVWRFNDDEPWTDYGFTCVAFGDRPAAAQLELAKKKSAQAGNNVDPITANKLIKDSFVDDGITGGSLQEVREMKGARDDNGKYTGTVQEILDYGGFQVKVMVASGDNDDQDLEMISNKVLGYGWNARTDEMKVNFPINLANKIRKKKQQPDVTVETLHLLSDTKLTKRICLGVTNTFVDFMGIAAPFVLNFKLLMKAIFDTKEISWNDQIPPNQLTSWTSLLTDTVKSHGLTFPRCSRPANALDLPPKLVTFTDGSYSAYAAAVYILWQTECQHLSTEECNGDFVAHLLTAKSKVTPLSGLSVPRSECNGLVLGTRLTLTVARALSQQESIKPSSAVVLTDSECVISALEKSTSALKPYFLNRISEIHDNLSELSQICSTEEVHHIAGELNIADLATQPGVSLNEIGSDSLWQTGPSFLCSRRELWPITREFIRRELPEEEIKTKQVIMFANVRTSLLQELRPSHCRAVESILTYSNSLPKVKSILARVFRGWESDKSLEVVSKCPTATELVNAEKVVLLTAMTQTYQAVQDNKLDSLMPMRDGPLIVTCGRLGEESMSNLLGKSALPILMPD